MAIPGRPSACMAPREKRRSQWRCGFLRPCPAADHLQRRCCADTHGTELKVPAAAGCGLGEAEEQWSAAGGAAGRQGHHARFPGTDCDRGTAAGEDASADSLLRGPAGQDAAAGPKTKKWRVCGAARGQDSSRQRDSPLCPQVPPMQGHGGCDHEGPPRRVCSRGDGLCCEVQGSRGLRRTHVPDPGAARRVQQEEALAALSAQGCKRE
mmetsp:Transcript_26069/g.82438  ORF Transcript_26069/g.82438 Transcript_26069/m.82438 type:complete len:209 (-) Transcript_26069:2090-2716(-)